MAPLIGKEAEGSGSIFMAKLVLQSAGGLEVESIVTTKRQGGLPLGSAANGCAALKASLAACSASPLWGVLER